jgi:hypothetical protein
MSKRKHKAHPNKPATRPAPAPEKPAPLSPPVAGSRSSLGVLIGGVAAILLFGGGLVFWLSRTTAPATPPAAANLTPTATVPVGPTSTPARRTNIGRATACQRNPTFSASVGLGKQVVASTAQRGGTGLYLFSPNNPQNVYQHPTWDDFGHLGQFVVDRDGNIYTVPALEVSVEQQARIDLQHTLLKVDTNAGLLAPMMVFTPARTANAENPFGLMGLAYDCDTHSLYVSSVGGSSSDNEIGRVYRVDLNTGNIVGQFENHDVLGIGIYNGVFGKRLYFGAARTAEIYSVALTDSGDFVGAARLEFALSEQKGGHHDHARRVAFNDQREMTLRAWPFDFNLIAASTRSKYIYKFKYNDADDTWGFTSVELSPETAQ